MLTMRGRTFDLFKIDPTWVATIYTSGFFSAKMFLIPTISALKKIPAISILRAHLALFLL